MPKNPPIEACFAAIEQAIEDLDGEELPLEKSLAVYEAGLKHVRLARQHLDSFARRLEELRDLEDETLSEDEESDS